jgi:DNA mismatch repair protein MutS
MTEVINLKNVVEKAKSGKQCFAVFDELFSGTNAEDAFEICKTTINGLTKFKDSYFFISTHIQELKTASNPQVSSYFIDCEIIDSKPMFNYKLNKGWSDIKVGQILFDKVGLNELLS